MQKETFDKKVAAIWQLFEATQTLNSFGVGVPVSIQRTQEILRQKTAEIGEALAAGLAV